MLPDKYSLAGKWPSSPAPATVSDARLRLPSGRRARPSPVSISMRKPPRQRQPPLRNAACRLCRVRCDVGDEADVDAAAKAILGKFPAIQILVKARPVMIPNGTVLDLSLADWNRVFAVNVGGAFLMSRAILPAMIAARRRQHHSYCLAAWQRAGPQRAAYCASKGALIQLAKAMATDHAGAEYPRQHVVARRSRNRTADAAIRRYGNARRSGRPKHLLQRLGQPVRSRGRRLSGERRLELHDRRGSAGRRRLQRDLT